MIGTIVAAILQAVFGWLEGFRRDKDRIDAHERAATSEAENETQAVLSELADKRSNVPVGGSAGDIAQRMRARKSGRGPRYSEEPPAE